jgi:hypothetical protein
LGRKGGRQGRKYPGSAGAMEAGTLPMKGRSVRWELRTLPMPLLDRLWRPMRGGHHASISLVEVHPLVCLGVRRPPRCT